MNRIKAAIYCRISPFADTFTLSYLCGIQKSVLLDKAEATGFCVTGCYEDIGYSGSNMQRPALKQLLQDYAEGKFSVVLVVNRDRLCKDTTENTPKFPFPVLSVPPERLDD